MTRWQLALGTAFNVRSGEGHALSLLIVQSFFAGLCFVFFETAANALFFSTFDIENLPYVYIALAPVATSIGVLYARCERFLTPLWLMRATLVFVLASVLLFTTAYYIAPQRGLFAVLMVWKEVLWMLLGLEFWAFAGCLFNVRQGKRLFAVAASGALVAGLVGGIMVGGLVKLASTGGLLVASAIAAALTVAMGFHLTGSYSQRLVVSEEEKKDQGGRESLVSMFRRPYLRLIFAISSVSLLAYYLLDYAFYAGVEARYADEAELATFFGYFVAVVSLANLLASGLLSGRLITRFGVGFAICVLPVVVLLGSAAASASMTLGLPMLLFFWLVVGTKLLSDVLQEAIEEPTFRILYQPLPTRERITVQAKQESMIEPIGAGVCGLLLLGLTSLLSVPVYHLLAALVPLCALWVVLNSRLRKAYVAALSSALSKRRLGQAGAVPSDPMSRAIIERGIRSQQPSEAIYCLRLLEDHPQLDAYLLESVGHAHSEVRLHALDQIERRGLPGAESLLRRRLSEEKSPKVRGCLARTLCAVAEDDAFESLFPYLRDPHTEVRRGAMVGFLRSGGIECVVAAGTVLNSQLASRDPVERGSAADILGEARVSNYYRPLLPLMEDEDQEVRRAAVRAAGMLRHPKLLPSLVSLLSDVSLRQTAAAALVDFHETALPELQERLRDPTQSSSTVTRILRVVGHIGGAHADDILCDQLGHPSWEIQSAAYHALLRSGFRAQKESAERIESCLLREAKRAAWCWSAFEDMAGLAEGSDIIRKALLEDIRRCEDNLLLLLSCLYPVTLIQAARRGLRSESSDARAQALEILDSVVSPGIRGFVVALLDDFSPSDRLEVLDRYLPQSRSDVTKRLGQIIDSRSPVGVWTRMCSLYVIGKARLPSLKAELDPHLEAPLDGVRETARWAHARL